MLLVGLDFGSTTSSAMVARARVLRNCVTGRMELGELTVVHRAEPVFTPFVGDALDEPKLAAYLDQWLSASGVHADEIHAGGAIVTGLAAQAGNAGAIARLVRERLGDALVAMADDPCLESWLAFMGNCLSLSRAEPAAAFVNLDIGGGTTNLAWGRAGEVQAVGCWFIGARHLRFEPGSYRLAGWSQLGRRLLTGLDIDRSIGDELRPNELDAVLDFYVDTLEAAVRGNAAALKLELARLHEQVPFQPPAVDAPIVITFSGGVGELIYRQARGEPLPSTTAYGDLGIDLAQRLGQSLLSANVRSHQPEQLGRATVYGLTIHNTELSGSTLYLPQPEVLPLRDLPIIGRFVWDAALDEPSSRDRATALRTLVDLAARARGGACVAIECAENDGQQVKRLGELLAEILAEVKYPAERPLVLLVSTNIGKTLGSYATHWGRLPVRLIVLDEIACRSANFVTLGRLASNLAPVSFYGLQPGGDGSAQA